MKYFLLFLIIFSCSHMPGFPGHITETTSKFDNSRQLKMEPAWVGNGPIKFSLFKNSYMARDTLILEAIVKEVESISTGNSLHFNVDGTFYHFTSIDDLTEYEVDEHLFTGYTYYAPTAWSSKRYFISMNFLNEINNAQSVIVKLDLQKEFVESTFSSDVPGSARPPFHKFYQKLLTFY